MEKACWSSTLCYKARRHLPGGKWGLESSQEKRCVPFRKLRHIPLSLAWGLILNFHALPTAYAPSAGLGKAVGCILPRLSVIQRWERCIVVCRLELNPSVRI